MAAFEAAASRYSVATALQRRAEHSGWRERHVARLDADAAVPSANRQHRQTNHGAAASQTWVTASAASHQPAVWCRLALLHAVVSELLLPTVIIHGRACNTCEVRQISAASADKIVPLRQHLTTLLEAPKPRGAARMHVAALEHADRWHWTASILDLSSSAALSMRVA